MQVWASMKSNLAVHIDGREQRGVYYSTHSLSYTYSLSVPWKAEIWRMQHGTQSHALHSTAECLEQSYPYCHSHRWHLSAILSYFSIIITCFARSLWSNTLSKLDSIR